MHFGMELVMEDVMDFGIPWGLDSVMVALMDLVTGVAMVAQMEFVTGPNKPSVELSVVTSKLVP